MVETDGLDASEASRSFLPTAPIRWATHWPHHERPEAWGLELTLQRHLDRFPFAQFFHAAFPVGTVGLVIAPRMVFHQNQHVTRFPFEVRKGALNQQARLRQGQGRCFF